MTSALARLGRALCALAIAACFIVVPSAALAAQAPSGATDTPATVWGVGIPGASIQVRDSTGKLECTATVNALGAWSCAISVPDCSIGLKATETIVPFTLALPITIPRPFCVPQKAPVPPAVTPPPAGHPSSPPHSRPAQTLPSGQTSTAPTQHPQQPRVRDVHVVAGSGSALATWSTAAQPSGTVYTATAEPGGATCTTTGDRCLITGLKDGASYRIAVEALRTGARASRVVSPTTVTPHLDATRLVLALGVSLGANSAGSASTIDGQGLLPGSRVSVVVHSTPQSLGTFAVGPDGAFTGTVRLPAGLDAGPHQLIATGTGLDGTAVSGRTGFSLNSAGAFTQVEGTPMPGSTNSATTSEGATKNGAPYPHYDPRDHPDQTITTMSSAFALTMIAGGIASLRRRPAALPRPSKTRSGKKPSVSMSHQEFRADAVEPGDRSRTWVSPFLTTFDRLGLALPQRLNVYSPLLARLFNDAAYLRAMVGTWSLLSPIAGLVMGSVAVAQTNGMPIPPSNGLLYAILLWGICDALAGFAAGAAFTIGVVFSGGVHHAADLRALIALDVLFFAAILVVSATRDLRREPATNAAEAFDRAADFVVGAILAMWAVKAAVGALPALTGLDLPIAQSSAELVWLAGGVTLIRFAAETLAAHWYPERLLLVAPEVIKAPPNWRSWVVIATKLAAFVFFAVSYMGNHWPLWVSVVLMFVSLTMPKLKAHFPDWRFLAKVIPGGIIGLLFYFLLGAWSALALKNAVSDPAHVSEYGFFLLMIPGIVCAAIVLTARNGKGWELTWLWRWTGIPMLVLVYLIVGGTIAVV